jgi:quercetin dioxygenase-like cupin family protein
VKNEEVDKAKRFIVVEIIEYIPNSMVSTTILRKATGTVSVVSFDSGEGMTERSVPFDTFVQIIDGMAEILIEGVSSILKIGQAIIIPAHTRSSIKANERFKMISTVIKSGYEELTI